MKINVFLLLLLYIVIYTGCASKEEMTYEERVDYKNNPQNIEADAYLNQMREDSAIYFGEGVVEIGGDLAAARQDAKKSALSELSSQIEVAVKSDMEIIVTGRKNNDQGIISEEVQETINSRTRTYTDQVLNNVQGNKQFIDYPMPGYLTYFVYIDKNEYDEKVRKDLQAKKNMVKQMILAGDRDIQNNSFNTALSNWLEARNNMAYFFGDIPLEGDLNGNGLREEYSACLQERIGRVLGNMHLVISEGEFLYDSLGRLNIMPMVYLTYQDGERDIPVPNFPLQVSFIEGAGKIPRNLQTGVYGQLELSIEDIDSSRKSTRLLVEIDKSHLRGLENFSLPVLPAVEIYSHKLKTVAVSLGFFNDGNVSSPRDLKGAITSKVLYKNLSVTEALVSRRELSDGDLQRINELNADFLVHVFIEIGKAATAGGYDNMYNVSSGGLVSIYSLPQGEIIFSEIVPTQKGFGASADNAGWDAYGRMHQDILSIVTRALDTIE